MKKILRKAIRICFGTSVFLLLITLSCNWYVNNAAGAYLNDDIKSVPAKEYGLVLGTSKYVIGGEKNEYFEKRIEAAIALFNAGIIKKIIVSGDNRESNYNEPQIMKKELLKKEVPDSLILIDANGFNTYNSIISYKQLRGNNDVIIISQKFHNARAVFIAREIGINAIGYNAEDIGFRRGFKVRIREYFAKVKVILDLFFKD